VVPLGFYSKCDGKPSGNLSRREILSDTCFERSLGLSGKENKLYRYRHKKRSRKYWRRRFFISLGEGGCKINAK
jgi:hypothetical protein